MKNRRTFLKTAGALGLATTLPSACTVAAPKVATDPGRKHTVGHGDFRYEADQKWGNLDPLKNPVQHCHEMVLDSRGRLVCSTVSDKQNILIYNKDGRLLDAWQFNLPEPHGLSKAGEGKDQTFWVTDTVNGRVVNFDLEGRIIRELDPPTEHLSKEAQFKPTETTVTANGDIYVSDGYGSNKIFQYDAKGQLKNVFGGSEHFNCSHGIVVDERTETPTLLITSRAANEFQRWSLDGEHIMTRRLPGLSICRPVIDGENTYFAVLVTKTWGAYDGMVAVLDRDMNVVSLPGGSAPQNQEDFKGVVYDDHTFLNPHDVCLDEDKNLYVPQWYSGKTYPVRLRRV